MKTRNDTWRALVKGEPVDPADAHGYIKRAFRQTVPHVLGAMRLLAGTFTPTELNEKGFGLYAEFRPAAEKWGARSEMRMSNILALRRQQPSQAGFGDAIVHLAACTDNGPEAGQEMGEPLLKRVRVATDDVPLPDVGAASC